MLSKQKIMKINYQRLTRFSLFTIIIAALLTASCGREAEIIKEIIKPGYVIIHLSAEPNNLNPINSTGGESTQIYYHTTQELINADFKTMEIVPVLAKERAKFLPIEGSDLVEMYFEIRDSAVWDNGTPITAEDIIFSLKTIKIPQTLAKSRRPYFEFVKDVKTFDDNPRKLSFICTPYMLNETAMSDLHIIPKYFYDAKGMLDNYTIKQLSDTSASAQAQLAKDKNLLAFGEHFNSVEFSKQKLSGSGPYALASWETDERIVLRKKKDWWGFSQSESEMWYRAYPDTIIYEVIPDPNTAFSALVTDKINTMGAISVPTFNDSKKDTNFTNKFYMFEPLMFSYDFVGFNMNNPLFDDVNTRKALAHLMNIDSLIKLSMDGYAVPTACFSHPSKKAFLNPNVKPYEYDLDKAREYLKKAGWKDTNNDGILDKEIDGKRVPFKCSISSSNTSERRVTAARLLSAEAKKVGVDIQVEVLNWDDFVAKIKAGTFEMMTLTLGSSPFESDPKQIWHTDNGNTRGSNYCSYSNKKVDGWIEEMRTTMKESDRYPLYHKIHQQIHDDVPVIFLMSTKERIAVSKKFKNVWGSDMKPGFWASGFNLGEQIVQ